MIRRLARPRSLRPAHLRVVSGLLFLTVAGPLLPLVAGCAASHHDTATAELGTARSSDDLLAVLMEPGPVRLEKVVAADWEVDRSGLINLRHPTARAAGLEDGKEPIQLYLYVLHHPDHGTWFVDSGLAEELRDPASSPRIGFLVGRALGTETLRARVTTREWLAAHGGRLDGVFLTHIHVDHVMGLLDVPAGTPVHTGPGETSARAFLNVFTRGTIDRLLDRTGPLREWRFEPDPAGRFAGVLDIFGDGAVWAIHVPGHSPGSTAFVVRTPEGPQLLLGDATHTAWGWRNGVEPGSFSLDGPRSAESLAGLVALSERFPGLRVHPGHQSLSLAAPHP